MDEWDQIATGRLERQLEIFGRPKAGKAEVCVLLEEPGEPVQVHYRPELGGIVPHLKEDCPHCPFVTEKLKNHWYAGGERERDRALGIVELPIVCWHTAAAAAAHVGVPATNKPRLPPECLCGCGKRSIFLTRGLCSHAWTRFDRLVRAGRITWDELEADGRARPERPLPRTLADEVDLLGEVHRPPSFVGLKVTIYRGPRDFSPRYLRCDQRVPAPRPWPYSTRRELAKIWNVLPRRRP